MKKINSIPLLLLTSGILLGGFGTYFVHLATSTEDGSDPSQSVIAEQTNGTLPTVQSEMDEVRDTKSTNTSHLADAIEDPSLQRNAFQRTLAVYSYVASLSELQITEELERTSDPAHVLSSRVLKELHTALIERLAVLNPVAALKFSLDNNDFGNDSVMPNTLGTHTYASEYGTFTRVVNPLDPQTYAPADTDSEIMPVVRSVFKDWALRDLDDAVENAKSLDSDPKLNALAGILTTLSGKPFATFRDIAKTLGDEDQGIDAYVLSLRTATVDDPKAIWTELMSLVKPDQYDKMRVFGNIAEQWYEKDGVRVLDQINATPLEEFHKRNIVDRVLRLAATNNPQEAFQYAQTLPTEKGFPSALALVMVVDIWAETDPQAAYHSVTRIEQLRERESLQTSVVSKWAANEPYYYMENLDNFPTHTRVMGITSALGTIAQTSPQEAAELALDQKDEGLIDMLSAMLPGVVLRHWVDQDVEAAVNWVTGGPVPEDKQSSWVRALTTILVRSDPRRAFEIALKQPKAEGGLEAFQPALEAALIDQIVYRDLDLAVELLPKVPEGKSRSEAYASVGSKYIDQGEFDKAVNLGLQLTPAEQAQYYQSITSTWARIDPGGLVESIKDLPTSEIRSSIAQELSSRWMKQNFTDAQLEELKQYMGDTD
ncbi:MAG: hypothetical protein F4X56_02130 [Gammaproteobacteria bacterium]|nr:hypothetical protein [Gammaproteobacteria bacterium]MYC24702.1 hypothetical protein [Gammaproteobacteria bacterium]